MTDIIILHHYDTSPYSEKVRLGLGLKGLVPSVIAPLNWIERRDGGPRSGRFQNPELDDASGQETAAARVCWKGSATA